MAYQQGRPPPQGYNGAPYGAAPPNQPSGHPYMHRSPSFEHGDDTARGSQASNPNAPQSTRYRAPSTAGMQNAELYMGPQSPSYPPRSTSYNAGGPTSPTHAAYHHTPIEHRYNPQQYGAPVSQHVPQTFNAATPNTQAAHQPYNPAAYQPAQTQYPRSHLQQQHSISYQASPQPPPPPPRPHLQNNPTPASPRAHQDTGFSSLNNLPPQPPLPPRHQPLPPLPGASPPRQSHQYTPPAPPPPPFTAATDAYPSNVSTYSSPPLPQRPPGSGPPRISLPPVPSGSSFTHQRTPSPIIHRRPVPPPPGTSTPGTPATPGPAPPPHSQLGEDASGQHPLNRPLPGPPPEANADSNYFNQTKHTTNNSSGMDEEPTYNDLMQEVEAAAVMGTAPFGTPHQGLDDTQESLVNGAHHRENVTSPLFSGPNNTHVSTDDDLDHPDGHISEIAEGQYVNYEAYSDRSDAEADAGLAAMQLADEQDAIEEARRRSGSAAHRVSQDSDNSDTRRRHNMDMSSDSDVNVDMDSIGGGFSAPMHYGNHDPSDRRRPPLNLTRSSEYSDRHGGVPNSQAELYEYPPPGSEFIHPFAPARVDTGGTGGLSEPSARPRRMSFEDGDESTLAESEEPQTSGTLTPSSGMPEMFFHPGPGGSRPLPAAPVQTLRDQTVPQLMPAGTYQNPDRLLHYDQYGRPTFPAAPDAYNQLLSPSGTPVPRSSSLVSHGSVPQTVPPIRSKTDADRAKILREQQRQGYRSASIYGSDAFGDASVNPSAELLGLPEIPAGKRGKYNPAKLSTSDFKKCSEPWALSSVLSWIREMSEGEAYLKENAIVDGIVALFTHEVPTMNTADAETLGAKVVRSMFESEALLQDEEWVKFGSEPMSGVLYQLTGTGCYAPRVHSPQSPANVTSDKPSRCYSHHCMRTLKKINLHTQSLEPQRKVEDWATFYGMKKEDLEGVSKVDIERQFNLHEVVTSEDIFMDQLDVLRVLYRDTLIKTVPPIIDSKRRDDFVRQVFGRVDSVKQVNEDYLLAQLKYRQQEQGPWIPGFSDIFREWIRKAKSAYIEYAGSYPNAKYMIRQESERNVLFRQFLDQMRENERSKRLGYDTYLEAPIKRLQRYSLLLSTVHKHMPQESEEKANLGTAIEEIRAATAECDARVADMSRHAELSELALKLQLRPGMEKIRLNLTHLGREILYQGDLQRTGSNKFSWVDCHAILFDHYLVLAKSIEKRDALGGLKSEKYDVSKVPIPMDLLVLESRDDDPVVKSSMKGLGTVATVTKNVPVSQEVRTHRQSTSNAGASPGVLSHTTTASSATSIQLNGINRTVTSTVIDNSKDEKVIYPFRVRHLGRTEVYVLYASSREDRKNWCDKIVLAKIRHAASLYKQNAEPFRLRVLADTAFAYDAMTGSGKNILIEGTPLHRALREVEKTFQDGGPRPNPVCRAAVNCATSFNQPYGIPMVAVGTDYGVYVSDYKNPRGWSRAIAATRVTQIAVLEEFSLMLVISDKSLIAHHLDTVCPHPSGGPSANNTSESSSRRAPQKLSGQRDVGFFSQGRMKDRQLVFYKKRDGISSTFKVLEPVYQKSAQSATRNRFGIRKGTTEFFRDFDEFYIPSETYAINLFQTTLAIATAKGIEVMTLDKKLPLSIPDLKPPECASIAQRLTGQRPLGMFRLSDSEFLLVFEEIGVYVNKHGDISRAVVQEFVGRARQACLYAGTYLILVDHGGGFVEVRNAFDGRLRQIVSGHDVKMLDDGGKTGTVKICMQHPEWERCQVIVEMIVNEGLKE